MDLLVCGATGKQGGAVCRAAVKAGFAVRALVRNTDGLAAGLLQEAGVELVIGDFDQPASLSRALCGVRGVYSVQPMHPGDADREVAQGCALARAAADAGVAHFVYASTLWSGLPCGVAHFDSKHEIERCIAGLALPATVLRLGGFLENLLHPRCLAALADGKLVQAFDRDRRQPVLAVEDVGAAAVWCLQQGSAAQGRDYAVYGEWLSPREQAALIGKARRQPVRCQRLHPWLVRVFLGRELAGMFRFLNSPSADRQPGERPDIPWTRFSDWLVEQGLQHGSR